MAMIETPSQGAFPPSWSMVCLAGCLGLLGALVFAAFPQIDLSLANFFYVGDNSFFFSRGTTGNALREVIRWAFILACIAAFVGFGFMAFASRRLLGLGFAAWIYIILCAALGAGLVANTLFKDQWGRARPNQIVQFGGTKQFTAPLTRTDQCARNCSFVSGEAASIFVIGFAIALLAERARRRRLFLAALAAGSFAGFLRIGGGGHFLSDVFFAAIFMAFVARGLYWLLFERFEAQFADEGPFHKRTMYAGQRTAAQAARLMERAEELRKRRGGAAVEATTRIGARLKQRWSERRRPKIAEHGPGDQQDPRGGGGAKPLD